MRKLLRGKIYTFIAVFVVVGVIASLPAYIFYSRVEKAITDENNKQAISLAASLSSFIENNSDKYEKLYSAAGSSDGENDTEYRETMIQLFLDIKESTGAKSIYTEKYIPEAGLVNILDTEVTSREDGTSPATTDKINSIKKTALQKFSRAFSGLPEHDKSEKLISAFAPIKNKETGKILGIVGVDFSTDYVRSVIEGIRNMILTAYLLSILLVGLALNTLIVIRYKSMITDYMTNLYNKYHFENCIKWCIKDALKSGSPFSVMVIDIDDFKIVNDRCGHIVGDEVLKKIAISIKENTRDDDLCFRYGGDEFVVILPNTTKEQAAYAGKRMQSKLPLKNLLGEDPTDLNISLSVGIAQWEPRMSAEDITEWADRAMYASKTTGKNRLTLSENPA